MIARSKLKRVTKGISLNELATKIGCHGTQLSNFEHGRWALPTKWRELLACELSVKVSDIMDERGLALWIEE